MWDSVFTRRLSLDAVCVYTLFPDHLSLAASSRRLGPEEKQEKKCSG
jgi:hypothetical protein